MNIEQTHHHKLINTLQSVLLIVAMAALLGVLGWMIAGGAGVWLALVFCLLVVLVGPAVSPRLVLRMYRAQPISPRQAPDLYRLLKQLSAHAELPRVPSLFYIPSRMLNAFAVGDREAAALALTDGLLRNLTPRELIGVLAHEISHVRHNDMWVMNLADVISRITVALSQAGLLLLLISVPLILLGVVDISPFGVLLLIFAPTIAALLQLALSRTREFDADLGAVELTGDPQGLASALQKLERYQGGWLERIFMPGRRAPEPALLRTHPPTEERIDRLMSLLDQPSYQPLFAPPAQMLVHRSPMITRHPRWHWHGLWY